MAAATSAAVTAAVEAGHDDVYAIADHLGVTATEVREVADRMVDLHWLARRNVGGVIRYSVAERQAA